MSMDRRTHYYSPLDYHRGTISCTRLYTFEKERENDRKDRVLRQTNLLCVVLSWCELINQDNQGPVVQSVVSLTTSLRVISLTVLADSIYNILIFFAEKM